MSEWIETQLEQLTTKIGSGATPRGGSNEYKTEGISLIRSQNVLDLQFSFSGLAFIDDDQARALNNVIVEPNDVLLNITGDSVARVCMVNKSVLPARVNQHVAIIRSDTNKLVSDYLLYNLTFQKEELLSQSEIGATRRAITKGMIEKFKILLPPLLEQKAIASVLTSLDDKIDLLHRQNKTLEAMAETLFRQWFVERRPELAEGEADERWEEGVLGDVMKLSNGKKRPNSIGSIPVYGGNGILNYTDQYNYDDESIIIGRVGAYCGSLYFENQKIWVSDNALHAKAKNKNENFFLYNLLRVLELNSFAEGSSHPLLTQTLLNSIDITLPPTTLRQKYNEFAKAINRKVIENNAQIQKLEKLRNILLPKLMSGEVRVKEGKK